MLKPSSILRKNGPHLIRKKRCLKRKPSCDGYLEHAKGFLKHHQFASSFEKWNLINNENFKGNENENPFYYAPLVIFQRYKFTILSSCDTPFGSFYCVYTLVALW
jgi:hypothetical protein